MDIFLLVGAVGVIAAVVFFNRRKSTNTPDAPTSLDNNAGVGSSGGSTTEDHNRLIEKSDTF